MTTISGGVGTGAAVGRYYDQLVERQKDVDRAREAAGFGGRVGGYYESVSGAFWMGAGAERLGLEGAPGRHQIARLVDGFGADGEQLGRKFGESSARAFDVTFSVQKEVSVLWAAAGPEVREVIEQAMVDAATAVLADQVGARAATRMRTGPDDELLAADGRPVMVPAEGPAVAIVPEFTSRLGDPQLHVHGLVSSKVWEPTTQRWLALEARELKQDQRAMSGMFHGGLETELSRRLGVTWGAREYRYARTIDGIDDSLVGVFSRRSVDVDERLEQKLERFEETLGHAPTPQQRWKLEREAAVDSRPSKGAELLDFEGWRSTISGHTGMTADELVRSVTGNQDLTRTVSGHQLNDMIAATIGELSDTKSSWSRGDFKAEFTRVLPTGLAVTPAQLVEFVNTQTDAALDRLLPVSADTVDVPLRRWTTSDVLDQEARILEFVDHATSVDVAPNVTVGDYAPEWIDDLQLAAAARVASRSDFEVVVGLAGAGKTSMLTAAVESFHVDGRDVFGLAPSSTAAEVLGTEVAMPTENVTKFLWEHTTRDGGPSEEYELEPGGTLIIDEAGMVSTPQWDHLTQLAQTNGWRIVAVGDGYQFSAVGRGGIFDHLTNTIPDHRISRLEQVHRFNNTWEGPASAAIRQGDATALDVYERHDRIIATGDRSLVDVVTGLYMDRHDLGVEVGVFAATNHQVDELNTAIQQALATRGHLGKAVAGTGFHIGDQIETRRNDRNLTTDQGQYVKNRDRWTITQATKGGALTVNGKTGTVRLPADYVSSHVNLAYAQTSHGSQGRTITGTSIYAYDPDIAPTDRAGIYVPLTRGRTENLAVVHADNVPIAKAHLTDAISRRWIDSPAISHLHNNEQEPTLAEQANVARQTLNNYEQQSLFDPAPTPTIEPTPLGNQHRAARRSQAQHQPNHPTTPPTADPVTVLSPQELIDRLLIVDRLGWGVDNALDEIEQLDNQQTQVRDQYRAVAGDYNNLLSQRTAHADKPPLVRGIKKWETALDRYDRQLGDLRAQLDGLSSRFDDLGTQKARWGQYRSLATQLEVGQARNDINNDRQHRGQQSLADPDIIARLGIPPTEPEALTAWKQAAGAISQQTLIKQNFDMSSHPHITHQLKTDTRTAIRDLGDHIGPNNIPELQPTRTRTIPGPSLGL